MFAITVTSPVDVSTETFTTNDPYGWLDGAYDYDPHLIVLSIDTV